MDKPSEEQLKFIGGELPDCCDYKMLTVDRNNLWNITKGLDKLKESINEEILRGIV